MKYLSAFLLAIIFISTSCSVESEKINYGKESCHFCKMTIVDTQHASEAVTSKGKVFKYDAIECMINDLKKKESIDFALLFINDYSNPATLIDAKSATYLISETIKSPMGAYLSGFNSKDKALNTQKESGGKIYSWSEIQQQIN